MGREKDFRKEKKFYLSLLEGLTTRAYPWFLLQADEASLLHDLRSLAYRIALLPHVPLQLSLHVHRLEAQEESKDVGWAKNLIDLLMMLLLQALEEDDSFQLGLNREKRHLAQSREENQ